MRSANFFTVVVSVAASVVASVVVIGLLSLAGVFDNGPHFHPIPGAPHRDAPMFHLDRDAWGSVNKTRLDVTEQFGLPRGVKAVLLLVSVRDAHSFDHDCWVAFGNTPNAYEGQEVMCSGLGDGHITVQTLILPVQNDELWFETRASGPGAMNIAVTARGYWK
jgi:hypothetical protein